MVVVSVTAQRKNKPVMMPVPDASWAPILPPSNMIAAWELMDVKREASLAHQTGQNRVGAVVRDNSSMEDLLSWGANGLAFSKALPNGVTKEQVARACWFLGQGQPVRDVLLLESRLAAETRTAVDALLALDRDFDLASPETFAKLPMALNRSGEAQAGSFSLGSATYHVMAVAPSDFWSEEILDTLLEYINAGGRVVFVGRQPLTIQRLLFRTGVVRVGDLPDDIARGLSYASQSDFHAELVESGERAASIRYQHRRDDKRDYFYVLNSDRQHAVNVRLGFAASGSVEEWDLATGIVTPTKLLQREIPAGGTVALVVTKIQTK